jgi:hypothetical protein
MVQVDEIGNLNSYMLPDLLDRFYGLEARAAVQIESGNFLPGACEDVNVIGYLDSQFMWGKNQYTFYRHPTDDFRVLMSTKNILGR